MTLLRSEHRARTPRVPPPRSQRYTASPGLGMIADTWAHLGYFGPWAMRTGRERIGLRPPAALADPLPYRLPMPHMHRESVQGVKQYRWNRVVAPLARHRSMQCEVADAVFGGTVEFGGAQLLAGMEAPRER